MHFFNPTIVALVVTITGFMVATIDAAITPTNVGTASMRKADHHQRHLVARSNRATWFTPSNDRCTGETSSSKDMIAALSDDMFGNKGESKYCGKCAHVKGPIGLVVVKIVDACPTCEKHSLDLSRSAFERIAPPNDGDVPIQ
ncbi:hypothetical protein BDF22DRAFT_674263 [Syncephalis plumigaleata]|nr:hypothetical protein BDF22DRAFT_674263 [Syncephalis plumigaleata]